MNITQAIDQLVPSPDYGGFPRDEAGYEKLRWRDGRPKPTWAEIEVLLPQDIPPPPDTRPSRANAAGTTVPQLRADVDAIWEALVQAGIVK